MVRQWVSDLGKSLPPFSDLPCQFLLTASVPISLGSVALVFPSLTRRGNLVATN